MVPKKTVKKTSPKASATRLRRPILLERDLQFRTEVAIIIGVSD